MPNPQTMTVAIQLDRERMLRYGHNALAELEIVTGKTVQEIFTDFDPKKFGYDLQRKLLWAGLIFEDPTLKRDRTSGIERVGDLIEYAPGASMVDKLIYVCGKIVDAVNLAWAGPNPTDPAGPPSPPGARA